MILLIGTIVICYVSGVLEVLSLYVVITLLKDIKCKEIENLMWMKKISDKSNFSKFKTVF
jgi:hypothetical protein